jgi:ATP-dependent Clp protease protease subunit
VSPPSDFIFGCCEPETRTIIVTDINDEMVNNFIKAVHVLELQNDFPIHLIINSRGGDWEGGLAIYDTIKDFVGPVSCEVRGKCMSMAVIIAQACQYRWVHPNASVMVHNGNAGADGDAVNFENWARYSKHERQRMYELLAARTGHKPSYWRRKCGNGDLILTADQAVKHGLFDEVIKSE